MPWAVSMDVREQKKPWKWRVADGWDLWDFSQEKWYEIKAFEKKHAESS